ncbi:MAG: PQQ-binding-like beta-propeller repeat protein, partial [Gemmatimonadota bacterium]|nr:PQQ-binding-like beta-propeller repeat protein [Gemmatimonadota bacterium]
GLLVVAGAGGQGLFCLEAETGRRLWHIDGEKIRQPAGLALAGGTLVVCDRWNNRVSALGLEDGKSLWSVETADQNGPLLEPAGVALVENTGGPELWVTDRSNHRVCRYSTRGQFLDTYGRRGLWAEETAWNNTRPEHEPPAMFMEFPEAIFFATDSDREKAVFILDSGNCRCLCFTPSGKLKRAIGLESGKDTGPRRHSLNFSVLESQAGPVFAAIDDDDSSLLLWSPHGELVSRTMLGPALFDRQTRVEAVRIISAPAGMGPELITSRGTVVELKQETCDLPALLEARATIQPENGLWALAEWEARSYAELQPGEAAQDIWTRGLAGRDLGLIAGSLLPSEEHSLQGRLGLCLDRADAFIRQSASVGLEQQAKNLSQAILNQLAARAAEAEQTLLDRALPEQADLEAWTNARTILDLALFQKKGDNQAEAFQLDPTLEAMKEFAWSTSRRAWVYNMFVHELERRDKDPAGRRDRALRLVQQARDLLEKRTRELCRLDRLLDYNREPTLVRQQELKDIHRSSLRVESMDRITHLLGTVITGSLNGGGGDSEADANLRTELEACLGLAPGAGPLDWKNMLAGLGNVPGGPAREKPLRQVEKTNSGDRLELLRSLVRNMAEYLRTLSDKEGPDKTRGSRILDRQKEIFALKAALLIALIGTENSARNDLEQLSGQARRLAGSTWKEIPLGFECESITQAEETQA